MVNAGRRIIAVVDDDSRVRESLENLFESAGHSVRMFSSATDFLEQGRFVEVDCIVSDIGMPEIDGIELARLARLECPELPVILITGRYELVSRLEAVRRIGLEVFQKPFDGQALLAAVAMALAGFRRPK